MLRSLSQIEQAARAGDDDLCAAPQGRDLAFLLTPP
jgi:hypothetical protein